MKALTLLLSVLFPAFLAAQSGPLPEETLSAMHNKAVEHFSTAPYFTVIVVKNMLTGEQKEICTEGPFVLGALNRDNCPGRSMFKGKNIAPTRYVKLGCPQALKNVSYDLYTEQELEAFSETMDFDSLAQAARDGNFKSYGFAPGQDRQKVQRMFAHLMFNRGIMMTRGCIAGNWSMVEPYEE